MTQQTHQTKISKDRVIGLKKAFLRPLGILTCLVLIGTVIFFSRLSFPDSSYNFLGESKRVELTPGAPVTQVFTAKADNLEGVKVFFRRDELSPGENIQMALHTDSCSEEIARQGVSVFSPEASIYRTFSFPQISDSKGKQYCLSLTYNSPYPKRSERPEILVSEGGYFMGMSYTDTGKKRTYENRSLQIHPTYGEPSFIERFWQLENRLSQYKPAFVKGEMLSLAGLVVLLSIFLVWLLSRPLREEN